MNGSNSAADSRDSRERYSSRYAAAFGVLRAILKKNCLEFVRYPAEIVFSFVMPVVWFLPTYFLIVTFAPGGTSAGLESWTGTSDFYSYFVTGLIVSYITMSIFWGLGFSLKRLMFIGLLETIWSYPISKTAYIIGESLFVLFRSAYELILISVLFRFLFGIDFPPGFFGTLPWMIPFISMMYGFGIAFASVVMLAKDANTLVDTSSFLVSTLTGTQNPPQVFPKYLLAVSMAIPITYFLDFLRVRTIAVTPLVPVWLEMAIILACSILFPVAGILFFRWTDRRCRMKGNLSAH